MVEKYSDTNFNENGLVGADLYRRTDRQTRRS